MGCRLALPQSLINSCRWNEHPRVIFARTRAWRDIAMFKSMFGSTLIDLIDERALTGKVFTRFFEERTSN